MARTGIEELLEAHEVKPTKNRIIVARELTDAGSPLSLGELDDRIGTLEKSSILRVLNLFLEHRLVHAVEDGRGVINYEICHGAADEEHDSDVHPHFYCVACRRIFCFDTLPVPEVDVPKGFKPQSVNYMLKGLCPDCSRADD